MSYKHGQETEAARRFMRRLESKGLAPEHARAMTKTAIAAYQFFAARGEMDRAEGVLSDDQADFIAEAAR